jgi:putative transposase
MHKDDRPCKTCGDLSVERKMLQNRLATRQSRILHPLARYFRDEGLRLSDEIDIPPYQDDPEWLWTPAHRRAKALARLGAIAKYERIAKEREPGVADIDRLASSIGESQRSFYKLLGEWSRERSIFSLIPWAGRASAHNPKLEDAVRVNLMDSVWKAATGPDARTPRDILAEVLRTWPKDGTSPPSEQTIRAYIADTVGSAAGRSNPFSLNSGGPSYDLFEIASHPGEVVVIDHTAPDLFVCREGAEGEPDDEDRVRPALSMAIDLHTQIPVGIALGLGMPTAESVREVLRDAERRSEGGSALGLGKHTRIMLSTTGGKQWRKLVADLAAAGVRANIRWSPRLHFGGPTTRLIGRRLGKVPLVGRKLHKASGGREDYDARKHALVTMDQARIIIEAEMRKVTMDKLGRAELGPRLWFGLDT